VMYCY